MGLKEAIKYLEITKGYTENDASEELTRKMCDVSIEDIKEIQQYREIGTVEECREAVEKLHTEKDGCVIVNKENMIQIIKVLAAGKVLDFKVDSRCAEGYVQAMKDIIEIFEKGGIE